MIIRNGRRGQFLGCSGYPKCKNTAEVPAKLLEEMGLNGSNGEANGHAGANGKAEWREGPRRRSPRKTSRPTCRSSDPPGAGVEPRSRSHIVKGRPGSALLHCPRAAAPAPPAEQCGEADSQQPHAPAPAGAG